MPLREKLLLDALFTMKGKRYSRLLLDVRQSVFGPNEQQTDALQIVNMMRRIGFSENDRIALLQQGNDHRRLFFEKIATVDGFDLKYFTDQSEAIFWLGKR